MNTFDQKSFLEEHIPYRLGNLDACFHALRILNSEPRTRSVTLRFDTGHEMRGHVALVTNAWVETGIITCRTMLDFLEGKTGTGHTDDITICSFSRHDGQHLAPVLREKIVASGPEEVSSEFTSRALRFAYRAANKAVAHLTRAKVQDPEAVQFYQTACLTLVRAVHFHLYDALGIPRPPSMIREFRRSEEPGL
jgi:hypothetical protein